MIFLLDNRDVNEITPTLLQQVQQQRLLAEKAAEKTKVETKFPIAGGTVTGNVKSLGEIEINKKMQH